MDIEETSARKNIDVDRTSPTTSKDDASSYADLVKQLTRKDEFVYLIPGEDEDEAEAFHKDLLLHHSPYFRSVFGPKIYRTLLPGFSTDEISLLKTWLYNHRFERFPSRDPQDVCSLLIGVCMLATKAQISNVYVAAIDCLFDVSMESSEILLKCISDAWRDATKDHKLREFLLDPTSLVAVTPYSEAGAPRIPREFLGVAIQNLSLIRDDTSHPEVKIARPDLKEKHCTSNVVSADRETNRNEGGEENDSDNEDIQPTRRKFSFLQREIHSMELNNDNEDEDEDEDENEAYSQLISQRKTIASARLGSKRVARKTPCNPSVPQRSFLPKQSISLSSKFDEVEDDEEEEEIFFTPPNQEQPSLKRHERDDSGDDDDKDSTSRPACKQCRKLHQRCDRERPCKRCKDAGRSADCASGDDRKGAKSSGVKRRRLERIAKEDVEEGKGKNSRRVSIAKTEESEDVDERKKGRYPKRLSAGKGGEGRPRAPILHSWGLR